VKNRSFLRKIPHFMRARKEDAVFARTGSNEGDPPKKSTRRAKRQRDAKQTVKLAWLLRHWAAARRFGIQRTKM
jgi:hypothetical protein